MKIGIDISKHNGVIDWEKVKGQVDYAIIRCGYGMNQENQDDQYFKRNVEECIRLGIPFGIYLYSYANTLEKADSEAEHVLRLVNPYKDKVSMGIWYDIEDKIQANLDKSFLRDIITTFCNKIESNGYFVGIYANKNWLENRIEDSLKSRYAIWVAQYNSKCTWNGIYVMWQYTSDGSVDGISGRVDMNNLYKEELIGQATVAENANVGQTQTVQKKDKIDVDGKWGQETTRKAQKVFGTPVDGIVSNQYLVYKDKNKGLLASTFDWKEQPSKNGSVLIGAIQERIGVKKDGFIGPDTITGMQKWLGTTQDGYVSNPSEMVRAFQEWLNKQ